MSPEYKIDIPDGAELILVDFLDKVGGKIVINSPEDGEKLVFNLRRFAETIPVTDDYREPTINELAQEYNVKPESIRKMLDGGIPVENLPTMLGLRNALSITYGDTEIIKPDTPFTATFAKVPVDAVIKAHKDLEGDLDMLGHAFGHAQDIANERLTRTDWKRDCGIYAGALREAVEEVRDW